MTLAAAGRTDLPATTAALRAVLALHDDFDDYCWHCHDAAPCATVRAIAEAFEPPQDRA